MKVIMFHYVMPEFDYYHFDLNLFEEKIKYLKSKYKILSLKDYHNLMQKNNQIGENYIMLTFDDGTIDHYRYVYPILKKHDCSGLFFIPSCIFKDEVLNIQLIHKLLSLNKFKEIYNDLIQYIESINFNLDNLDLFNTYDDQKVRIFKQLLQHILPTNHRKEILFKLCEKYNVSTKISDYYMSIKEMREMKKNNMFFGIHTNTHPRLSLYGYDNQYAEIYENMEYLVKNKLMNKRLMSIAYPFGTYNNDTLLISQKFGIKYGFKASITDEKSLLEIDRIDCKVLKEGDFE